MIVATLRLECRAIEYATDGHFTASPPCNHRWTERVGEYPMDLGALVERLNAARRCPKCGVRGKVYVLEPKESKEAQHA